MKSPDKRPLVGPEWLGYDLKGAVFTQRNWARYAYALDLYLRGYKYREIGAALGVSVTRASQMVAVASREMAQQIWGKGEWRYEEYGFNGRRPRFVIDVKQKG